MSDMDTTPHVEHDVLTYPTVREAIRSGEHDAWLDGLERAERSALGQQRPEMLDDIRQRRAALKGAPCPMT